MKHFIREENLKLFRDRLNETTDPEQRRVLLKLLADETVKDERPHLGRTLFLQPTQKLEKVIFLLTQLAQRLGDLLPEAGASGCQN
jgi:hypothetical protein